MATITAIISDIDGTLIDTTKLIRHGIYETVRGYLQERGVPAAEIPGYADFEQHVNEAVGGTARESVEKAVRLLYRDRQRRLEGIDYDALYARLDGVQDGLVEAYVKPFAGLEEMLTWTGQWGLRLALFTSGTPYHVVRNMGGALPGLALTPASMLAELQADMERMYGLKGLVVVTSDDVRRSKPNPEGIEVACRRLGVVPEQALMLGDHWTDMEAAKRAGVDRRVGITHGFDDAAALRAAGATDVITRLDELPKLPI